MEMVDQCILDLNIGGIYISSNKKKKLRYKPWKYFMKALYTQY